jgi:hypothetical protein
MEVESAVPGEKQTMVVLDAFFQTILHLREQQRSFNVLLRSFGSDVGEVALELDSFFSGSHPQYQSPRDRALIAGMDGSEGGLDYRLCGAGGDGPRKCLKKEVHGTFFRTEEESVLVMGTLSQPRDSKAKRDFEFYKTRHTDLTFYSTPAPQLHAVLQELLRAHGTLAIRDDWPFWSGHGETSDSGKLFLVDPTDIHTHQIFFDDNIGNGKHKDAYIVDVRDASTGAHIPDSTSIGRYIAKVHPLSAITDPQYFVKLIRSCETKRR